MSKERKKELRKRRRVRRFEREALSYKRGERQRLRKARSRNRNLRKQKYQQNAKRRQWEAYVRRKEAEEAAYFGWRDPASHFWRLFDEYRRAST